MENAIVNEKKEMNKTVKIVILFLVIILTVLAGIAIGWGLFNLLNPQ